MVLGKRGWFLCFDDFALADFGIVVVVDEVVFSCFFWFG